MKFSMIQVHKQISDNTEIASYSPATNQLHASIITVQNTLKWNIYHYNNMHKLKYLTSQLFRSFNSSSKNMTHFFFRSPYCESWLDALLHTPLSFSVSGDGDLEVKDVEELCCSMIFSFFLDALLLILIKEFIICNQPQNRHVQIPTISLINISFIFFPSFLSNTLIKFTLWFCC